MTGQSPNPTLVGSALIIGALITVIAGVGFGVIGHDIFSANRCACFKLKR